MNNPKREFIDQLHNRKKVTGEYGVDYANLLNRDIATAFVGGLKFVYELLQNAIDSAIPLDNSIFKPLDVVFELFMIQDQFYLLFSHNAQHFGHWRHVYPFTHFIRAKLSITSSHNFFNSSFLPSFSLKRIKLFETLL